MGARGGLGWMHQIVRGRKKGGRRKGQLQKIGWIHQASKEAKRKKEQNKKIACRRIDQRGGERKIARGCSRQKWLLEAAEAPFDPDLRKRFSFEYFKEGFRFSTKNGFQKLPNPPGSFAFLSDLNLQRAKIQNTKCDMQVCKMQKWLLEPAEALDPSQISNPAPPDLNLRKRFSTVSFKEGLKISIEKFLHIKRGHHSNWVESLMSGNWHTMKKKMISKR